MATSSTDASFDIFSYSKDNWLNCLEKQTKVNHVILSNKSHIGYFDGYLKHINAKTVLVEKNYIDKDFLEDFAHYYVRNFHPYQRICTRLHFFKNDFDSNKFQGALNNDSTGLNSKEMQDNYLGFMVIKPLPWTIIGKTCLVSYDDRPERNYCVNREYIVNLFGIELTVNSLAYQEQDSVVAACASIALWTSFQKTGILYHHTIPTPVEITKSATLYSSYKGRHFPMKDGLTPEQMAQSIRNVGLEPFCVDGSKYETLKCNIYAYLKGGIPPILGILLHDPSLTNSIYGGHAITVTGFCMEDISPTKFAGNDLLLTSSKINKIYVHDDGLGAYAHIEFKNQEITYKDSNSNYECTYKDSLPTEYYDSKGIIGNIRAIPTILIFPLYHKIRIPYNKILSVIQNFNATYNATVGALRAKTITLMDLNLEWDIYLCNVKDFKKEIFKNTDFKREYKIKILTTELPKFIWRAKAILHKKSMFEFLFDATDIEQGEICLKYIQYDESYTAPLINTLASFIQLDAIQDTQVKGIFKKIIEG